MRKTIRKAVQDVSVRPIHPFPARMAPDIALKHLKSRRSLRVLDPMVGSGTVPKIAHALGHRAVGFDTDPLALLISETWCSPVDPTTLKKAAARVVRRASDWSTLTPGEAYPPKANAETRKFIRYWFDIRARRQLAALTREIRKLRKRSLRLALLTAISRTIIVKEKGVSLAKDVAHSRPHKAYTRGPVNALAAFERSVEKLAIIVTACNRRAKFRPKIRKADARMLPLRRNSIDLVMTSPPYLNAIDYLRGHKFSLVWFGFQINQLRTLRSTNIGAESADRELYDGDEFLLQLVCNRRRIPDRLKRILLRYITDIQTLVAEIDRVLRPSGKCIFVVGDSNVAGAYIRNSLIVSAVASSLGLKLQHEYRRRIPDLKRYLPPPSAAEAGRQLKRRMRTEVILVFKKPIVPRKGAFPRFRGPLG